MLARRIGERQVLDGPGDEFFVVPGIVLEHGIGGVVGPAAGGVGEKVIDSDIGDVLLVGSFSIFCAEDAGGPENFVVEIEFALFEQREDGDGSDGFADAGDAEDAGLLGLQSFGAIHHAKRAVVNELAVAGDGDGGSGHGELLIESPDEATHFAAISSGEAVGSTLIVLEKGTGAERKSGQGGDARTEEMVEQRSSGQQVNHCVRVLFMEWRNVGILPEWGGESKYFWMGRRNSFLRMCTSPEEKGRRRKAAPTESGEPALLAALLAFPW